MEIIKRVYRHEKKYLISWHEFQILNNKLKHLLKRDANCPEDGYEVKSLYFDNPYNSAMKEKIEGTDQRHKFRLRVYNNNFDCIKLEKKSKHNAMTYKESIFISQDEATKVSNGDYELLKAYQSDFLNNFYYKLSHGQYTPKVVVKYSRIAYLYSVGDVRITFDYKIQKSHQLDKFFNSNLGYMDVYPSNSVIMEIKFNHVLPCFLRSVIQMPNVMVQASSKYVASRMTLS